MSGGRERGADEGGLADARLALDEHCVATALGELSQQPVEQRKLVDTAGQHAGRGYRMHGMKRTSCASAEQAERFRTLIRRMLISAIGLIV